MCACVCTMFVQVCGRVCFYVGVLILASLFLCTCVDACKNIHFYAFECISANTRACVLVEVGINESSPNIKQVYLGRQVVLSLHCQPC